MQAKALAVLRLLLDEDDPHRRAELIETHCADDPNLRAEVDALLVAAEADEPALDQPVWLHEDRTNEHDELLGQVLGPFTVVEIIGRGGMGTVYRAEREVDGGRQQVAIKVIRRGLDSDDILARFLRERRILAALSHPNLTRLIDGGRTPDGRPWLALDYVDGEPITTWCDRHQLHPRERIVLLLQVADAVQHAHERLVVHRDIKPGNVLVDVDGQVRLLDFGIAKLVDNDDEDLHTRPLTGQAAVPLTPEYAAPEQILGGTISASTDVYALGVLLYQLLSGRLPRTFRGRDWLSIQQELRDLVPPRLAHAITGAPKDDGRERAPETLRLQQRSISLGGYRRLVRGDLDRILAKALADEPERRYASVQAFADDLRRFLAGEPVAVVGTGWRYRARKFIVRNRLGVTLTTLSVLLLLGGLAGFAWQAAQTRAEAERALAESARATAIKNFLGDLLTSANPLVNPGQTPTVRQLMDAAARRVDSEFADRPDLAAELLGLIGTSYRHLGEMPLAEQTLEAAMHLVERNHLDAGLRASIQGEFMRVLIGRSDLDAAVELADQALRELPDEPRLRQQRSAILNHKATASRLLGLGEQALQAQREAIDQACAMPGAEQMCLGSQIELKYFLEMVDDYDQALVAAESAWRTAEAMYPGQAHPLRLNAIWSYGDMLSSQRQSERAIALLESGVELAREIYGEENFRYARALDMLAVAHNDIGNLPQALDLTEQAFAIGSRAVPQNPLTAFWLQRIVDILLHLHQPERAAEALTRRWPELPEQLPRPTPDMFDILRLRLRLQLGNEEAETLGETSDALVERLEASASPLIERAIATAFDQRMRANDPDGAHAYLAQLRQRADEQAGSDTSFALAARLRTELATARLALVERRFDDTENALSVADELLLTLAMPENPWQAERWLLAADLACLRGDHAASREAYRSVFVYWNRHLGDRYQPPSDDAEIAACRG